MAVTAVVFTACGNSDLNPVIDNGGKASVVLNTSAGQVENLSEEEGLTGLSQIYMADIRGIYLDPTRTGEDRLDMVDTSGHRFSQLGDKTTVLSGNLKWKGFALYCASSTLETRVVITTLCPSSYASTTILLST